MVTEKLLRNFVARLKNELLCCGCVELDHRLLKGYGLDVSSTYFVNEYIYVLRDIGFHVVVNKKDHQLRYFIYNRVWDDDEISCDKCPNDVLGCGKVRSNSYYAVRCLDCAYDVCRVKDPDSRDIC